MPGPVLDDLPRDDPAGRRRPVVVPTDAPSGFRVTVEQLEAARTPRTKLLLFVSPVQPDRGRLPAGEIEAIGRWAVEHGMWVVTDEIYEHLVYGDAEHHSMPVVVPELADRCVVVNGVAKTYAMTGWRVGWMIGPADVIAAATNLQSHETSNVANVSQRAALAAVSGDCRRWPMMREAFDRRRRTIHRMLNEIDGVELPRAGGGVLRLPLGRRPARPAIAGPHRPRRAELAELAIEEAKVAVVPGEAFGAPGLLPPVLRPGRRRPGRRRHPAPRPSLFAGPGRPVCDAGDRPRAGRSAERSHPADERNTMGRVLVTEKMAQPGLDLMAAAGHEVDVQLGLTPEELVGGHRRGPRPRHPLRHQGHRRGAGRRHRPGRRRPGRHRPRQRRRGRRHRARRDGGQRPPVQHPVGGRAGHGAAAGPGPQHPPGPRRPGGRASGSGRSGRASSCTARRSASSAWAGSGPWWPSGPWPSGCGWSPTTPSSRPTGPGTWASSCMALERADGAGRLRHRPPARRTRRRSG